MPYRIFATQSFFPDHLKQKTVNKASCRDNKATPCQLCAH